MALPSYASTGQRIWYYGFRVICALIFLYLIFPILVIIPLSFNVEDFFTFTPGMLRLDPDAFSLKHYRDFFTSSDWQNALWNSFRIAGRSIHPTRIAHCRTVPASVAQAEPAMPMAGNPKWPKTRA